MTFFARLFHDSQRIGFVRQTNLPVPPETFPLQDKSYGSKKGDSIYLSDNWYQFDKNLNTNTWLTHVHTMLFNSDNNPQRAESISCGGNVVEIDYVSNNHGHLVSFYNDRNPINAVFDYFSYPQFIHKVTCVKQRTGEILKPGRGLDVYFALVAGTEFWVDLSMVEPFPPLGMTVSPEWWAVLGLKVRSRPYGDQVGGLFPRQEAMLTKYDVRGSDVWGRIQFKDLEGWICLQRGGTFFTNWQMKTSPPP